MKKKKEKARKVPESGSEKRLFWKIADDEIQGGSITLNFENVKIFETEPIRHFKEREGEKRVFPLGPAFF